MTTESRDDDGERFAPDGRILCAYFEHLRYGNVWAIDVHVPLLEPTHDALADMQERHGIR